MRKRYIILPVIMVLAGVGGAVMGWSSTPRTNEVAVAPTLVTAGQVQSAATSPTPDAVSTPTQTNTFIVSATPTTTPLATPAPTPAPTPLSTPMLTPSPTPTPTPTPVIIKPTPFDPPSCGGCHPTLPYQTNSQYCLQVICPN